MRIPDNSKVICPICVHEFRAICVDDQARIRALEAALRNVKIKLHTIVDPWIGVSADLLPPSVIAAVPLLNELHSALGSVPETKGDASGR